MSEGNLHRASMRETPAQESVRVAETVAIATEGYRVLGPRIGASLVEGNVLLTLGGMRGQTEFFIDNHVEEDRQKLNAWHAAGKKKGIYIFVGQLPKTDDQNSSTLVVDLWSLKGLERSSQQIDIPGVRTYIADSGWDGVLAWYENSVARLEALVDAGRLPFPKEEAGAVLTDVCKGYPARAIYDAVELFAQERHEEGAVAAISHMPLYGGSEPNFIYKPEHANDPDIQQTVATWGRFLSNVYTTSWHQTLSSDPQFLAARRAINRNRR